MSDVKDIRWERVTRLVRVLKFWNFLILLPKSEFPWDLSLTDHTSEEGQSQLNSTLEDAECV